jgi:phosphoesterase RecJ-like protein
MNELKELFEKSDNILITSHLGPDPDALCSSVLLYKTLQINYPDKKIAVCLEETITKLEFIDGYKEVSFEPLAAAISRNKPEMLVILDANNLDRCSRKPEEVRQALSALETKIAVVDHHEPEGKEDNTQVFINQKSPACVQDIYQLCFEDMSLKKPDGYAQTTMFGLYADTGGFIYDNPQYQKTFSLVSKLIDDGASIEFVKNTLEQYSAAEIEATGRFFKNLSSHGPFNYSYLDDEFVDYKGWNPEDIKGGGRIFINDFSRNIDGRQAGFCVYRDLLAEGRIYSVSFRAVGGGIDVAKIAAKLGGGGHKASAGTKIKANSVQEAVDAVKSAIELVE